VGWGSELGNVVVGAVDTNLTPRRVGLGGEGGVGGSGGFGLGVRGGWVVVVLWGGGGCPTPPSQHPQGET